MLQKLNRTFCGCGNGSESDLSEVNDEPPPVKPSMNPAMSNGRREITNSCTGPTQTHSRMSNNRIPAHGHQSTGPTQVNTPRDKYPCGIIGNGIADHPITGIIPTTTHDRVLNEEAIVSNPSSQKRSVTISSRRRKCSSGYCRSPTDPIMSYYSAADLEDPPPEWNAYNPKDGVAWAPKRSNKHRDPNPGSFRKFRSVGSIQSLRSVRGKVFSRSSTSLNSVTTSWTRRTPGKDCPTQPPDYKTPSTLCPPPETARQTQKRTYVYRPMNDDSLDDNVVANGDIHVSPSLPSTSPELTTQPTTFSPTGTTTTRRRCYTDCSSEPRTPHTRQRIRTRSRSRASICRLDKSWASFDEYNWDTSVLVLDNDDGEVFFDEDEEDEELQEDEGYLEDSRDDLDGMDRMSSPSSPSGPDDYPVESVGGSKLKRYLVVHDLSYLFIPRRKLRTGKLLMRGDDFCVCCGCLVTGQHQYSAYMRPVSVQIYKGMNSDEDQINFLRNVKQMRKLRHPNIQEVLGVCMEGSPMTRDGIEMLLVTDKSHYQVSLQRLLHWVAENNRELLSRRCGSQFALQICRGLQYLKEKRILHTNLTSATVVLDWECNAKLGSIEPHPISTRTAAYEWMAIESLRDSAYSHKSTVWSFGVILWEIVSVGMLPYNTLKNCQQVFVYLSTGRRLTRPAGASYRLYNLMYQCWHPYPRQRPSFNQIISALTQYQQSLPVSRPARQIFPDREDFWQVIRDFL